MADFIRFENVSYTYDETEEDEQQSQKQPVVPQRIHYAVEHADFTIQKGEFVAIVGRNGSGKSTLARTMNALLLPSEGVVYVNEIDTSREEMIWEIRSHVGMVFQNPDNQIVGTSVEEDVAFGMENLGVPRSEMIRRMDWALETVKLEKNEKQNRICFPADRSRDAQLQELLQCSRTASCWMRRRPCWIRSGAEKF